MTVIQTVAGGAGGSGQVIDLRNEELSISGSSHTSQTLLCIPYDSTDLEIYIDGKRILTKNCLVQRIAIGVTMYKKDVDTTVIDTVKAWLENILPGLSNGTYRIVTLGCGILNSGSTTIPYWTLTVTSGVYSLAYSGTTLYYPDTNPIKVKIMTIARIS